MKSSSTQKMRCTKFMRKGQEGVTRRRVKRNSITKGKLNRHSESQEQFHKQKRARGKKSEREKSERKRKCFRVMHCRTHALQSLPTCKCVCSFFFQTFSIFRMSSSASSFWEVMMHDTHKLASTIAGTPSKLSEAFFTMGS